MTVCQHALCRGYDVSVQFESHVAKCAVGCGESFSGGHKQTLDWASRHVEGWYWHIVTVQETTTIHGVKAWPGFSRGCGRAKP
jgi:hypothetical protein